MLSYARGAMLNVELFSANTCDDELFSFELFHEQIGGYLELPLLLYLQMKRKKRKFLSFCIPLLNLHW